jgi:hypothetical protein
MEPPSFLIIIIIIIIIHSILDIILLEWSNDVDEH